jgi:Fe-S oxidoreductase
VPVRLAIGLGITVIMLGIAGRRFFWLYQLISSGQPAPDRFKNLPSRIKAELVEVGGQKKLLQWTIPGMAHAFTFWGFSILFLTIIEAYGDLFQRSFHIPIIGTWSWIGLVEDFFTVAVLLALIVFAIIRVQHSPKREERKSRFFGSHTAAANLVLAMIAGVMISLLFYRAAQANTGNFPYTDWAFASHVLASWLHPLGTGVNSVIETVALLANIAIITSFLVFVAYSKHLHIFLAPVNVATSRRPRALGALATTPDMTMEDVGEEDEVVFGAGRVEDLSWKQLLDLATCTECGRCQSQCPAWNTGKPLSPKLLIMSLRDNLFSEADRIMTRNREAGVERETLVPSVIEPDVLWSCTTCGACVEECPVDIEHIDTIIDLRRYEVLIESRFPSEAGLMLRNVENQGDPWGLGAAKREDWIASLDFEVPVVTDTIPADIEYLYWVGCAGALDERARKGAQATARMLHRAGVSFAILGKKESCTGDPVRRLGNEYLFQEQCHANIETLNGVGAKKIIATCPHCFNTLSNEYPALGGNYEVIHHSQLLDHLVAEGKLTPGGGYKGTVTYHDPCYLGRHNRVFDEPRSVIDSIPGAKQVEMGRCREKGFCCGAGGARMWLEENIGKRVNMERTEEALGTGADVVSTACPYCMIMLDDAVRAHQKEDDVRVLDLSQLLEESMGDPVSVGAPSVDTESAGETGSAGDGPVEPG